MEKGGSPRKPCGYKNHIALSNSDESDRPSQPASNQQRVTSKPTTMRRKSHMKVPTYNEAIEKRKRIKTSFNLEEIVANLGKVIEESKFVNSMNQKIPVTAKLCPVCDH